MATLRLLPSLGIKTQEMFSPTGYSVPLSISRVQYNSESELGDACYNILTDQSNDSNRVEPEGSSIVAPPTNTLSPTTSLSCGGGSGGGGSTGTLKDPRVMLNNMAQWLGHDVKYADSQTGPSYSPHWTSVVCGEQAM
jgi:hypothetical protein